MSENKKKLVGILEQDGRQGVVYPDGKATEISKVTILPENLNGAPFGMKVIVELTSSKDSPDPLGEVVEVLGDPARADVAMESIMQIYGLSEEFPKEVEAQLKDIPKRVSQEDIDRELALGRKDLRNLKTITIDGVDAKDLDDAISIKKDRDGSYILYVHIADVSHYVPEGSALDTEAFERGNSVYLADRVIPMLPPKLSNGVCSLNPGQPRLAVTVMLKYDSAGGLIDGDVFESIVISDLRADYDSVKTSLESEVVPGYEGFMSELQWMRDLARRLSLLEEKRGALEFNSYTTEVEVDKDGKVLDVRPEEDTFANEIIEQFMIAANSFIAEKFRELGLPFIYRVHGKPDGEKLERFKHVLETIVDKKVDLPSSPSPKDIQSLLKKVSQLPGAKTLENLLLRAQAKAIYSEKPQGHFGLALKDYTHFTAPIRRYSDLFIHRVIKAFLRKNLKRKLWEKKVPEIAEYVSTTERLAVLAERDSVDQKVAEYYEDKIGQKFTGTITGFVGAGMFVMIPSSAEGMVPFRTLNDYYVFDEKTMTAQGKHNKRLFLIGDQVQVELVRADVIRRQIDFELVDEEKSGRIAKDFAKDKKKRKKRNKKKNKKRRKRRKKRRKKNKKRKQKYKKKNN